MDLDKIRAAKVKLETEASAAIQKLVDGFEKETSVLVEGITISGLTPHPSSTLNKPRDKLLVRFELGRL